MVEVLTLEVVGLFVLLAGFVVGLGAVTVIDVHGFLGGGRCIGVRRRRGRIR